MKDVAKVALAFVGMVAVMFAGAIWGIVTIIKAVLA